MSLWDSYIKTYQKYALSMRQMLRYFQPLLSLGCNAKLARKQKQTHNKNTANIINYLIPCVVAIVSSGPVLLFVQPNW